MWTVAGTHLLLLSLSLSLSLVLCGQAGTYWTYSGSLGQDRWAESFPACGGDLQSPVDVETSSAQHDPSLTPVRPLGYSQPGNDLFTLTNNGHTVEMSLPGTMALEGLPWRFSAVQLHLHWGSGGQGGGAEHLIDGQSTNAELHVVHYNSDLFPNVSAALSQQGGLAVLAVLIQTGEETNPAYQNIFNYLGNVRYTGQKVSVPPFNVQMLLPKQLDRFYRYNGSLTTPPCYQSVLWTVFSERVTVSYTQMERLQTALVAGAPGSAHVVPLQDNFRGTQPLNGRLILTSFPPDSAPAFSVGEVCAVVVGVLCGCGGLAVTVHFIVNRLRSSSSWDVLPSVRTAVQPRGQEPKEPKQNVVFKTTPDPEREEGPPKQ